MIEKMLTSSRFIEEEVTFLVILSLTTDQD